jgi:hypothetical protein
VKTTRARRRDRGSDIDGHAELRSLGESSLRDGYSHECTQGKKTVRTSPREYGRSAWQIFCVDLLTPRTSDLDAERKTQRLRGIELATDSARLLIVTGSRCSRNASTHKSLHHDPASLSRHHHEMCGGH